MLTSNGFIIIKCINKNFSNMINIDKYDQWHAGTLTLWEKKVLIWGIWQFPCDTHYSDVWW